MYIADASNGGFQGHKSGHSGGGGGGSSSVGNELVPDNPAVLVPSRWSEPYFDTTLPQNVTALAGKSAYLSCRVINLGNKTVRTRKPLAICIRLCVLKWKIRLARKISRNHGRGLQLNLSL